MIVLVSGATASLAQYDVGVLVVPRQWNKATTLPLVAFRWAMDNGAFAGFEEGAFVRMLERFWGFRDGCLFVTAPDVVADAAATLARWPFWSALVHGLGYRVAFVIQDGIDSDDVPWDTFEALFVGGSTEFKESELAATLCGYAKAKGLWVHWGRVNTKRRLKLAIEAGADSIDGSGFSRWPDTNLRLVRNWEEELVAAQRQGDLFPCSE
jgi:hypothetical protein